MIKYLLAALIFLNVSLASVEIEDEGEDIDYDAQDDRTLGKEVEEGEGGSQTEITRMKGDDNQGKVIRQYIENDKKRMQERERDKFAHKIPYSSWADDSEQYRHFKEQLFIKLGWTNDYTKFWGQQAPNVGQMSADKYAQYIRDRNGSFLGVNQTWVVLVGTSVDNGTQDVAREMNILARKFKRAKKTTYRWDFVDYIVDDQLSLSLTYRNAPSLYVIDGHDDPPMMYAWDKPFSETIDNRTLGLWLKDRDYRQSKLQFEAPRLMMSKVEIQQAEAAMWLRKHVGWGFQNSMRSQPQFLKNLFSPIMDHDGNDPLRLKADFLIELTIYAFIIFVVLPSIYLIFKMFFWVCSYTVIIEIDNDKEWLELRKKGLVE